MIVPRCFLSWRVVASQGYAPQIGEIIGILKQLMAAQKEEEGPQGPTMRDSLQRRRRKLPLLTATIETKLTRQGNLAVEVGSLKNDVVDTQRSLAADQELAAKLAESSSSQSSEWEERQESRAGEGAPCESRTSRKTHALFTSGQPRNVAGCLHPQRPRTGCHVIHMVLCARRGTRCGAVFLFSHGLSQVGEQIVVEQIVADPAADPGRCAA